MAHGRLVDCRGVADDHRMRLAVHVLRPLVLEGFPRELEQHYSTLQPGLPAPERQARLREIDAQLSELEREEENLIRELAGAGVSIDRRPDADPRVLLGLAE